MSDVLEVERAKKEFEIPMALLGSAFIMIAVHTLWLSGPRGVLGEMIYLSIGLAIQTVLGVIACLLAGKLMGCDYGALFPGILKLAAIFIFPMATTLFIPGTILPWIIQVLMYWGLIEWLFELDALETIVTVIVIWVVQCVAVMAAAAIMVSTVR